MTMVTMMMMTMMMMMTGFSLEDFNGYVQVLPIYLGCEIPEEIMRKLDRHRLNSVGPPF